MKKLHPALEELKGHPRFNNLLKDPDLSFVLKLEDPFKFKFFLLFLMLDERERKFIYRYLNALIRDKQGRATKKDKEIIRQCRKQLKQMLGDSAGLPHSANTARSI